MILKNLKLLSFLGGLFLLMSCALISDQPDEPSGTTTTGTSTGTPKVSKELGQSCLNKGDLGCAKENFCNLHGVEGVALRCCLSSFLEDFFSKNTEELGKMLGYSPVAFTDLKGLKREEILEKKALPFAELFLLPSDQAPKVSDLLKQWGEALSSQSVATADLNKHLQKLGSDLEGASDCLGTVLSNVNEDKIQKEIFNTDEEWTVSRRDLYFVKFVLGAAGYLFQGVSQYNWGFSPFPPLPLSDDFLTDVNGFSGGDGRWGELSEDGASAIEGKYPLLYDTLASLKSYSELSSDPSSVDDYLNWRMKSEDQVSASHWLKAGYQSLQDKYWVPVEASDYQVNLSSLGEARLIPNSKNMNPTAAILLRDTAGEVVKHDLFFEVWYWNVVRGPSSEGTVPPEASPIATPLPTPSPVPTPTATPGPKFHINWQLLAQLLEVVRP